MKANITDEELLKIAKESQNNSYAPYSNFKVGAALLCEDGAVYSGCNIENATYGATICAERCAISNAIAHGNRNFIKIAITGSGDNFTMPCGICRQVLCEFMPEGTVVVTNEKQIKKYKVKDLLPEYFTL